MDEENNINKIDEVLAALNEFKLDISTEVAILKVKTKTSARMWGLLGGGIPILIGISAWYLKSLLK